MSSTASGTTHASAQATSVPTTIAPTMRGAGWIISRLLVTLGTFLFAYAAWLPWEAHFNLSSSVSLQTALDNLALRHPEGKTAFLTGLLIVLGPLLAPLIWSRADSLVGAIATHLLSVWALLGAALTIWAHLFPQQVDPLSELSGSTLRYVTQQGFYLAVFALLMLLVGLALLLVNEWRAHVFSHSFSAPALPPTRISIAGMVLLTLGLLIWFYGFIIAAWAAFYPANGTYPANGALALAIFEWNHSNPLTPFITRGASSNALPLFYISPAVAVHAVLILLGVGAAMALIGGWVRSRAFLFTIWATLWWLTALVFAAIAAVGLSLRVGPGAGQQAPAASVGAPVTFLGLFLALVALAILWFDAFAHRADTARE
ncbi:MAG TPA: hypothetical protein VFW76_07655 [Ktedonobacterales bacterium]|nr:hypothetical protein [Ktedonobacterales bacterium]